MIFGNTSIKSRVNKVIGERIKAGQQKHDERVKAIDEEHEAARKSLEAAKDVAIETSASAVVEGIIGKIN